MDETADKIRAEVKLMKAECDWRTRYDIADRIEALLVELEAKLPSDEEEDALNGLAAKAERSG